MITEDKGCPRLGAGAELAGRYTLISEIGRGGTGVVWRAADRAAGSEVAVKVLHQRLGRRRHLVARFVGQWTALTGIEHPHLVTVHDLVFDDGIVAVVSELIDGQTLRWQLRRGLLPTQEVVTLGGQVASALARLHVAGVVHCDVKPENILVAATPDLDVDARLADLGTAAIAREIRREGSGPSDTCPSGTPGYIPPEASGLDPPAPAADVYALGVVLYELATGRGPAAITTRSGARLRNDCSGTALSNRAAQEEPPITAPGRIPAVPRALWRTVGACLRADPAGRPTAAQLAEHLAALGRCDTVPAVLRANGVTPATPDDELGRQTSLSESGESPTPAAQEPRRPEGAESVARGVEPRWKVGLPSVVACVSAMILVAGVGAVVQGAWSSGTHASHPTSTIPAGHTFAVASAERYFAPTGWICTPPVAPTAAGTRAIDGRRRSGALRLCLGIWDDLVHVAVHSAGAEPTAAPPLSPVPSTGGSTVSSTGGSSRSVSGSPAPRRLPVLSVKVELMSLATKSGTTTMTRVLKCDVSPRPDGNRCDIAPVAAEPNLTYAVAADVLPSDSSTPTAASFPKTRAVLTPLIQNERSQDHSPPPKEPKTSLLPTRRDWPPDHVGR